ncbi:MAG: transglutaminase-like domain-containing protein [Nanoarchaeota archaeon]
MRCFLALILVIVASVAAAPYAEYEGLSIALTQTARAAVEPLSDEWRIDNLKADLLYYPRQTGGVMVKSMVFDPQPRDNGTALLYEWDNLKARDIEMRLDASLDTSFTYPKIRDKVPFPLTDIPLEMMPYLKPYAHIDSDNLEVMELASSLAQGHDDLYEVVISVADWVERDVRYNLTTATASVSQKASWVLENRKGVCDEITTLFVAMLRSLGIPARYVSGLAYTDFLGLNDFGPHAWAEVYFPGSGWVPFDITYSQYGMVDATHIPLAFSRDAGDSSVHYTWLGWMADIKSEQLSFDTRIISTRNRLKPLTEMQLLPWKKESAFGSAMLLEGIVTNPGDAYLPLMVRLSSSTGISNLKGDTQQLLLLPNEERHVYWPLQIDTNLDPAFVYTFTAIMYTGLNETAVTNFSSSRDAPTFSTGAVLSYIAQHEQERQKTYSRKVELSCMPSKAAYYPGEQPEVRCSVRNVGNTILVDTVICLDACSPLSLLIGQEKATMLEPKDTTPGRKDVLIVFNGSMVSKTAAVNFTVYDEPLIIIANISRPDAVTFDDTFRLQFSLLKASLQPPANVRIVLKQGALEREWLLDSLQEDKLFVVTLDGAGLRRGFNTFAIDVSYEGADRQKYTTGEKTSVALVKVTAPQQLVLWINGIGRGFSSFDLKVIAIFAFVIGIIIGIIIVRGFRGRLPEDRELDKVEEKVEKITKRLVKKR